ncbi:hypothetical protein C8Q80DRAFT_1195023 [Daedaleopsis nitida]|nr:hypothetical protein C8Q80DRAFT_1195023 [Daedaleopsis nitida]
MPLYPASSSASCIAVRVSSSLVRSKARSCRQNHEERSMRAPSAMRFVVKQVTLIRPDINGHHGPLLRTPHISA